MVVKDEVQSRRYTARVEKVIRDEENHGYIVTLNNGVKVLDVNFRLHEDDVVVYDEAEKTIHCPYRTIGRVSQMAQSKRKSATK